MTVPISALILILAGVSYVSSQQCHMRELDLCMSTGILHYQSRGVPDDDEKVSEWCETVKEVKDCMHNYSVKCMSPMQRELSQLLGGGASETEAQLCTPGSELRNNYLKHGECLAKGADSEAFKTIVRDLQVTIETVFEAKFKDRLPTFCCGALRFHRDSEANTRQTCGEDAVDMLKIIMDMIFTELPKTICQSFDSASDTCKQLLPPSGTPPKGSKSESQIAKLMDTMLGNL